MANSELKIGSDEDFTTEGPESERDFMVVNTEALLELRKKLNLLWREKYDLDFRRLKEQNRRERLEDWAWLKSRFGCDPESLKFS